MAVLERLPEQHIIDGARGTIDFYTLRLIPGSEGAIHCARKWPTYRPENYPESSKIMQPFFAYVSKMWPFLGPDVALAYEAMGGGTSLTGKDMMVRCYLNKDKLQSWE